MMPTTPSPQLSAQIRAWIGALSTEGIGNWVLKACKEAGILPLHSSSIYIWAINVDGQILCMDHEAFGNPIEIETDPLTLYGVLNQGISAYPGLSELLPTCPPNVRQCDGCAGKGWVKLPHETYSDCCLSCNGLGWGLRTTG
jgi:hypothetical protein